MLQRVRAANSELIEEQEIFRRLSVLEETGRSVASILMDSRLARVVGDVPTQRPDRSVRNPESPIVGYINSNTDGDDGAPLTDYDIIGSATDGTGIFALRYPHGLQPAVHPAARRVISDVGMSTLMIAARFCRDRHAMLMVDPPSSWTSATAALAGLRDWPFRSENAVMFYPRVIALDRLRGRHETFGSCGAAAGMIARADETWPVWAAAESEDAILRPGLRPASVVTDHERTRLAQAGVNTLVAVRSSGKSTADPAHAGRRQLGLTRLEVPLGSPPRAFHHRRASSAARAGSCSSRTHAAAWKRAREQVDMFLESLDAQGAFAGSMPEESYFVICDERVNEPRTIAEGKVKLLFGIAITKPGDFQAWLITHQPGGASTCRPSHPNRLATSGRRVEWEIETAILRGVILE